MIYTVIIFIIELMVIYARVADYTDKIQRIDYHIIVNFHYIIAALLVSCIPILNNLIAAYFIGLTFDKNFMKEHF